MIGLTVVGFGAFAPDTPVSGIAAFNGNAIGSNIYNLLAVFSLPGLITPGLIDTGVIFRDMPALTLAIAGVANSPKGTHQISRLDGVGLLPGYLAHQSWIIFVTVT